MTNKMQQFSFVENGPDKGDIENENKNFVFKLVNDRGISKDVPERFDLPNAWIDVIRYDVNNVDFAGHLNIHFNGCGSLRYLEQRRENGTYYVKVKSESLKNIMKNPMDNMKSTILAVANRVARLHEKNIKEDLSNGNWTRINKPLTKVRNPVP